MKIDPLFGALAPEMSWVPAPRYLLRRDRILKLIAPLQLGTVLEIGCGSGALLNDLSLMGFNCTALEPSASAYKIAKHINKNNKNVNIHLEPKICWEQNFDYVFAFEVLEHIEDDGKILKQWRQWLKPTGRLLISVPGKPENWNSHDVWAGHYRRYEKRFLFSILKDAGFTIEHLETYGFPLANILENFRAIYHSKFFSKNLPAQIGDKFYTHRSGIDRPVECRLYPLQASFFGKSVMKFSFFLQNLFLDHDLGNGYLILAKQK
jgi:SAM-dependent methyltransferase